MILAVWDRFKFFKDFIADVGYFFRFRMFVTFLFLLYIKHKYLILNKKNYLFPKLWDFFPLFFINPFIQFVGKIS